MNHMTSQNPFLSANPHRRHRSLRWLLAMAAAAVLGVVSSLHAAEADRRGPRADDDFVKMVANVRPAVVAIGTYKKNDRPSVRYYGTGFAVAEGNLIVTNAHVVDALKAAGLLENMRLYLPDTTSVEGISGTLVASDAHHDVALIKPDRPILPALELEMSRTPNQGETVGVVGYPIGMALGVVPTVHKGVISAVVPAVLPLPSGVKLTPELAAAIRRPYKLYQLDMVVYPGNSGSPLLDPESGKVLGVINKTLATKTREHLLDRPSGISYAVPVRWIHELLARTLIKMDIQEENSR